MTTVTPSSPSRKRRNVQFAAEDHLVCVNEYENPIELGNFGMIETLWFQPWEMQACKDELKARARQWRSMGYGILLRDTFDDIAQTNPLLSQKRLTAFCQMSDEEYNRGIERYLSKQLDSIRSTTKRQVIRSVVEHSEYLKTLSGTGPQERENILALFARHQSRNAEQFARRIAKADEMVAIHGENQESSEKMLRMLAQEQKMMKSSITNENTKTPTAMAAGPATAYLKSKTPSSTRLVLSARQ